ncbi:MAG: enoyl-CoA hydratase-related protein [Rhizomicrobium sp.]
MTGYDAFQYVLAKLDGHVLTMTFNRPGQLNAVNGDIHGDLTQILALAAKDRDVRAIVLRGEGRAFCAGGDVGTMEGSKAAGEGPNHAERVRETLTAAKLVDEFLAVEVPIVAAVQGYAMGLGATIALLCDVLIMADDAQIADTHVNIGVVPGDGGAVLWPLMMTFGAAKWYLMTGERISGTEAVRLGLALKSVPADRLADEAHAHAAKLARLAPMAVKGTKATLNKIIRERINLVLDTGLLLEGACFISDDHKEAIAAFQQKRPGTFTGR